MLFSHAHAATVITGTLTITNAANIDATNAASITVNTGAADTRIWTNGVVTPATQILYTNSISQAAQRLLIHAATYPFAYCYLSQSGSTGIILRAYDDYPLTITLSNTTWGVVTYVTNTTTAAPVVRVPYTVESAATRTNVANGLVNWLNLAANTTAIDQTAAVAAQLAGLGNVQTITGAKTFSSAANVFSGLYLQLAHSALAVDSAGTNFVANFTGEAYRTITATNDINFVQSTNRAAVRPTVIFIDPNGSTRNLTFNSSWKFFGSAPTSISSGSIGVLSLTCKGTAETDVYAAYSVEGAAAFGATDIDTSAELRAILTDESGTGAALFAGGDIGAATATTPSVNDNDTSVATTAFVQAEITDNLNTSAELLAILGDETGSGLAVFGTSPTLTTPVISGAISFPDGVRQTFNPDGTIPGLNVGSHTADPATPSNGDIWYDSTGNLLRARVNGATISITGSAGGLASTDIDTSAEIRAIVTDETGTGALVFADGALGAATATTAAADDNDTSVATTAYVQTELTAYASDAVTFSTKKISYSAALGSDDTYEGTQITGLNNTGGTTQWDAVYLNSSSQWVLADANGASTYPVRGIASATVGSGNATTVITSGTIRNDAWNWTIGGTIYLSTTAGGLTQTPPATTGDKVQVIGYALTADIMAVAISADYGTAP